MHELMQLWLASLAASLRQLAASADQHANVVASMAREREAELRQQTRRLLIAAAYQRSVN